MPAADTERAFVDYLVAGGTLSQAHARASLDRARAWNVPVTSVIRCEGWAKPADLARHLTAFTGQPRAADLPHDTSLIDIADAPTYLRSLALPWARTAEAFYVAAVDPLGLDEAGFAEQAAGRPIRLLTLTQAEFYDMLSAALGPAFLYVATYGLDDRAPHFSARSGLWAWQAAGLALICLAVGLGAVRAPASTFLAASLAAGVFFASVMAFRLVLIIAALWPRRRPAPAPQPTSDSDLPHYSVLVALNREAELLPRTVAALGQIDYPASKLDILLILEERDLETRRAASQLLLDDRFKLITVPHGLPQTKPKACNFAMHFARGDYITLFDAEDRPDPGQLRAALAHFAHSPDVTCVQGELAFYNAQENILTRQFALEFAVWFELVLPGLERLRLPIPLGGTSNHFRTEDLKSVLAWDAFNVTEDADLGMRLSRLGHRAETLNSITREEANCHTANWIHQRSRWLKGYLQTYLVHMRNPHKLLRELGLAGFLTFQLLIGAAMPAAFFHAVFWGLLAAGAAGWSFLPETSPAASGLWAWSMALGLGGNGLAIVSGLIAAHRLGRQPAMNNGKDRLLLYLSALTMPVYWFLTSIAALKAIVSFVGRPFYWAKTRHGLSRF